MAQAEPYSWFEDNESLKRSAAERSHPELAALFKKDRGHNWDCFTYKQLDKPFSYSYALPFQTTRVYENLCMIPDNSGGFRLPYGLTTVGNGLSNYSALEYGRTAPTADELSMSAIIGELREGLPALIPAFLTTGSKRNFKSTLTRQTRRVRDAGSDYLNVQFGWIPLLSDVRKIATALAVATFAITGKQATTHRRRDMTEKDETITSSSQFVAAFARISDSQFATTGSSLQTSTEMPWSPWVSQRHTIKYSFEAEFVRLPEGQKDYSSYLVKLDELMRWDITPMDLWQLAPWSWLVDWFFDIGGQLDAWNATTSNRILSSYAYGMREETLETTVLLSDIRKNRETHTYFGPSTYFSRYKAEHKQRLKANPFGYVLNPMQQLSAGQLAILGALGLTKARR